MSNLAMMYRALTGPSGPSMPFFTGPTPYLEADSYPAPATAGIEVDADGGVETFTSAGNQGDIGRWDGGGSFNAADYDFRMDFISGTLDGASDPLGVWLNSGFGVIGAWFVQVEIFGINNFQGTLRMRPAGGGADIDTKLVQLFSELT